jgi:hypothetical protein
MFSNYENGNLREAKVQAQRYSYRAIIRFCVDDLQWSTDRAMGVADFLKGYISFQSHCENQANTEGAWRDK